MPKLLEDKPLNNRGHTHHKHDFLHPVRNLLNDWFPGRWIGHESLHNCPHTSSDLNPLDYFYGDRWKKGSRARTWNVRCTVCIWLEKTTPGTVSRSCITSIEQYSQPSSEVPCGWGRGFLKPTLSTGLSKLKGNFIKLNIHINPLSAELNPICHLLALLGAHHILHVSRIRVKLPVHNMPIFNCMEASLPL